MSVEDDLRALGYDPDEIGRKFEAVAQAALYKQFVRMISTRTVADWFDSAVQQGGEFTFSRSANGFVTMRYVENGEVLYSQNSPPAWSTLDMVTVFDDGMKTVRGVIAGATPFDEWEK